MKLVDAGSKKGKGVRLHPAETGRIFIDATDDGKDILIVGDRVVRVDEPSSDMYAALNDRTYGSADNKHTLLVETDDDPTPKPSVTTTKPVINQINSKSDLDDLADRFGYKLVPVTAEPVKVEETGTGDDGKGSASSSSSSKKSS